MTGDQATVGGMMKQADQPVTEDDARPDGKPGECFYCNAKLGDQHARGCVCRRRTVVVEATIHYTIEVPEDWNTHDIEFHRNESSWCSGNMVEELEDVRGEHDSGQRRNCLCNQVEFRYLREATPEDERRDGFADDPHRQE